MRLFQSNIVPSVPRVAPPKCHYVNIESFLYTKQPRCAWKSIQSLALNFSNAGLSVLIIMENFRALFHLISIKFIVNVVNGWIVVSYTIYIYVYSILPPIVEQAKDFSNSMAYFLTLPNHLSISYDIFVVESNI